MLTSNFFWSLLTYHIYTYTVGPRSSDPLYVVTCYIKWVTTSRTYSNNDMCRER